MQNIESQMESQVFKSSKDQLLIHWLKEGERYSSGECLPRQMLELHPGSRRERFKDVVSYQQVDILFLPTMFLHLGLDHCCLALLSCYLEEHSERKSS